jgi:hypothetical protein
MAIYFMLRERVAEDSLLERSMRDTARIRRVQDWIHSAVTSQTPAKLALEVRPQSGVP